MPQKPSFNPFLSITFFFWYHQTWFGHLMKAQFFPLQSRLAKIMPTCHVLKQLLYKKVALNTAYVLGKYCYNTQPLKTYRTTFILWGLEKLFIAHATIILQANTTSDLISCVHKQWGNFSVYHTQFLCQPEYHT